jgi:guanylate kinase
MRNGKLVLVIGGSGSGKGTLMSSARERFPDIVFPVSCTTRAMRPGEVEGQVYHFISMEEFTRMIGAGEFLEWAEYGGNRYGTPVQEVTGPLSEGKLLLHEIEVQGVRILQGIIPSDDLVTVYIDAGSWDILEHRIRSRAPISEEELEKRRVRYEEEALFKGEATYVVTNADGGIEKATQDFVKLIASIRQEIGLAD